MGWPPWMKTVGAAKEENTELRAECSVCHDGRAVDLDKVIALKGPDYSLINRRTKCTLTEACKGWIKFYFPLGVYQRMWDDETALRWSDIDRAERMKG